MHLKINGKGCDIGEALQTHIENKLLPAVQKYFEKVTDTSIVISKEKNFFHTDINVHLWKGMVLQAKGESADVYASFEEALEHMSKRLRRNKRRLRNHHSNKAETLQPMFASHYVINREEPETESTSDTPMVIAEMQAEIQTMNVSEAVMLMDLAGLNALMFKNSKNDKFNMVYARQDGHIGWIDPKL